MMAAAEQMLATFSGFLAVTVLGGCAWGCLALIGAEVYRIVYRKSHHFHLSRSRTWR